MAALQASPEVLELPAPTTRCRSAPAPGDGYDRSRRLVRRTPGLAEMVLLTAAAAATSVVTILLTWAANDYWLFNDFKIYWLAGRLVTSGGDPYDLAALAALAERQGVGVVLEIGYVYPIPFAVLMAPLSSLPFDVAAWLFTVSSVAAFAVVTALLIRQTPNLQSTNWRVRGLIALAAGTYPPVACSVVVGQVNLLVYALMGVAALLLLASPAREAQNRRSWIAAGLVLGVVTIVKLVPGVLAVPLALARRWSAVLAFAVAVITPLFLAKIIAPDARQGSTGLTALFEPDAWWTNQSINGFITRLYTSTSRTHALLDSSPIAPVISTIVLTAALAILTAALLWRARATFTHISGLALGMALALAAATIGAPKISFWNHITMLLVVWLLLRGLPAPLGLRALGRIDYALLAAWFFGAGIQWAVNFLPDEIQDVFAGPRNILYSSALYGVLAMWLLVARRLARRGAMQPLPRAQARRRVIATASVALVGCGVLLSGVAATALPRPARADMVLGVTFSPRYAESLGLDPHVTYERMLDDFQVEQIRLPVYWDLVEPAPGQFDFSSADSYIAAAERRGIAVTPAIGFKVPRWPECFAPAWATQFDLQQKRGAILDLLAAEVAHFRLFQNVSEWQVENEPLFSFGKCGDARVLTAAFLTEEVSLVHGLDSRPVLITDSGEFSTWLPAQVVGDRFGSTLYRSIWFPGWGTLQYPFWPGAYAAKDHLVHAVSGMREETVIAELQAEAWFEDQPSLTHVPVSLQAQAFPPTIIQDNVDYARQTGFAAAYLWGVEWWYWMEEQGYPEYIASARAVLAGRARATNPGQLDDSLVSRG